MKLLRRTYVLSAILLSAGCVNQLAALTSGSYEYALISGGVEITKFACDTAEAVIPATIDGQPVISIGVSAFEGCEGVTKVTIPASVTSIGEDAFYNCYNLTTVNIPEGVTSIEPYTFYWCTKLASISLPDSLTNIGAWAFENCAMTTVTIPSNVTTVGVGAFFRCKYLTNVTLPNSLSTIAEMMFESCTSLSTVTVPDSITVIMEWAFDSCTSLTSVYFDGEPPTFGIEGPVFKRVPPGLVLYYNLAKAGWAASYEDRPTVPFSWGTFQPVTAALDGGYWVDTGSWLGWMSVGSAPYAWSVDLNQWLYAPNSSAEMGAGWVYVFN